MFMSQGWETINLLCGGSHSQLAAQTYKESAVGRVSTARKKTHLKLLHVHLFSSIGHHKSHQIKPEAWSRRTVNHREAQTSKEKKNAENEEENNFCVFNRLSVLTFYANLFPVFRIAFVLIYRSQYSSYNCFNDDSRMNWETSRRSRSKQIKSLSFFFSNLVRNEDSSQWSDNEKLE